MSKVSTESYKGVRDFYPREQFIQRYILETWARVCEKYGYEEYNASILESAELYRTKTSDEIVNDQTYTFTDRGDREVTLRPEMTPTVTRMVAAKRKELSYPLRWYSVPNCFRYERAQRGRLREFWQLNADLFGASGVDADAEIILLARALLMEFGAKEEDFEIRISDRKFLEELFAPLNLTEDEHKALMRLLDSRAKLGDFEDQVQSVLGIERSEGFLTSLETATTNTYLTSLNERLLELGVTNAIIDTSITRGFDYYTGMVFEVFDTSPENNRSLMGGGRYDNLLDLFGVETVPTVGFAMGDVTTRDFLEVHDLLPEYTPAAELMLCVLDESATGHAMKLAEDLRKDDVAVSVNLSQRRTGDQIKHADTAGIPFVICIGAKERESGRYSIKELETGNEREVSADSIAEHMFSAMG